MVAFLLCPHVVFPPHVCALVSSSSYEDAHQMSLGPPLGFYLTLIKDSLRAQSPDVVTLGDMDST